MATFDDKRLDMHQYLAIGEVEMKPSFYDILDELLEKYYAKHEKDGKTRGAVKKYFISLYVSITDNDIGGDYYFAVGYIRSVQCVLHQLDRFHTDSVAILHDIRRVAVGAYRFKVHRAEIKVDHLKPALIGLAKRIQHLGKVQVT